MFIFAVLTDFFDGYFARKLQQSSHFGALLDPIADKVFELVIASFLYFDSKLPGLYFYLLFIRHLAQLSVIPVFAFIVKRNFKVKPAWQAKWATGISMIVLGLYLVFEPTDLMNWFLIISLGFEIYMLITFIPRYYLVLKGKHDTFE